MDGRMALVLVGIGAVLVPAALAAGAPAALARLNGIPVPGFAVERLDEERFRAMHAAVAPRGERWMSIPWEPDLAKARERAAREKKPLLMWVMDGHPLGCT